MELIALKCPNCGGKVTKGDGQFFSCGHCDSLLFNPAFSTTAAETTKVPKLKIKEIKRNPNTSTEFKKKQNIFKYILFTTLIVGAIIYVSGVIPSGRWDNKSDIARQIIGASFVLASILVALKRMRFNNLSLDVASVFYIATIVFAIFNYTSDYKSPGNWLTFATISSALVLVAFLILGLISIFTRPKEQKAA